jgi:hypothetical protein
VLGADSIVRIGDLTEVKINEAKGSRNNSAASGDWVKAMLVLVEDKGEEPIAKGTYMQWVVVRVIDQARCGAENLETVVPYVRRSLRALLEGYTDPALRGGGYPELQYYGRTGPKWDASFGLLYDALTYGRYVHIAMI